MRLCARACVHIHMLCMCPYSHTCVYVVFNVWLCKVDDFDARLAASGTLVLSRVL